MISAICFDVGDTLISTNFRLRNFIQTEIGCVENFDNAYDKYFQLMNLDLVSAIRYLCIDLRIDESKAERIYQKLIEKNRMPVYLYEDVLDSMNLLRSYRIITLSNVSRYEYTDLRKLGLGMIEKQFTSYEVGAKKPNRLAFHTVQEYLGLPADEILMVGDSIDADVKGAQAVGWKAILINRRKTLRDHCDALDNLYDLAAMVKITN